MMALLMMLMVDNLSVVKWSGAATKSSNALTEKGCPLVSFLGPGPTGRGVVQRWNGCWNGKRLSSADC